MGSMTRNQILNPKGFTIEHQVSPNKSRRLLKPLVKPRVVLVHATVSDNLSSPVGWFLAPRSEVSADFVIGKDGRIIRMVPFGYCAWHAGPCLFEGRVRRDYNYLSYGIELVNKNDGHDLYPARQVEALAYVIATIQVESPTVTYLRRHADVAYPEGRKSDPAGFSQTMLYTIVREFQPAVRLE